MCRGKNLLPVFRAVSPLTVTSQPDSLEEWHCSDGYASFPTYKQPFLWEPEGNMTHMLCYDDSEWHAKVGHTQQQYTVYQGMKFQRMAHPLSQPSASTKPVLLPGILGLPGLGDGQGYDEHHFAESQLEKVQQKLLTWPHMKPVVTRVCLPISPPSLSIVLTLEPRPPLLSTRPNVTLRHRRTSQTSKSSRRCWCPSWPRLFWCN